MYTYSTILYIIYIEILSSTREYVHNRASQDKQDGDSRNARWLVASARWRAELGVTPQYAPYSPRVDWTKSGLQCKPPKRTLDLIDCSVIEVCKKARKSMSSADRLLKNHLLDISQNHDRKPMSVPPAARALTTSSRLFFFDEKRILSAEEHLRLQGYEGEFESTAGVTSSDVRKFAGEGIALPCLAVVVWALNLTKKFHQ